MPSKSAIVRATFRMREYARAESPIVSIIFSRVLRHSAERGHHRLRWRSFIIALQTMPSPSKRASCSALAAEKRLTGLYHAVNGGRASWCDLACEAISLAEASCRVTPITSEEWPQKAKRPRYSVLNADKLAAALGVQLRAWPLALREFIYNHVPHETPQH